MKNRSQQLNVEKIYYDKFRWLYVGWRGGRNFITRAYSEKYLCRCFRINNDEM